MNLAAQLTPEHVISDMQSDEHWSAIVELVDLLASQGDLDEEQKMAALVALKAREEKSSTGIGGGIAIPHSFLEELNELVMVFGRSREGVDFCSLDRAPVHFVVLFLVPKSQHSLHLKTLASIAKILKSAETRNLLSEAAHEEEIIQILKDKQAAA